MNAGHIFNFYVHRSGVKEQEDGFSDEQQESSDDDMDWSGNNSLFANLSIPQVDGAADDSSGKLYPNKCPISVAHIFIGFFAQNSSLIQVSLVIMLVKVPLLFFVDRFLLNR